MSVLTRPSTAPTSAPAAIPPRPGPRLRVLDGLRLLAALLVVVYHYVGQGGWSDPARTFPVLGAIAPYAWLGVELFFLISGFVICMSAWGKSATDFLRGRAVRLFPAYWFCVLATGVFLLLPFVPAEDGRPTPSRILTNLTMVQNPLGVDDLDHSYWTLWAELRFYLLFAVVAWIGVTRQRVLAFCWLWTLAVVLAPAAGLPVLSLLANPVYAPLFISGTAFFLIRRDGPRQGAPWALLGVNWLLVQHSMIEVSQHYSPPSHRLSWAVCVAVVTAFYLLMAAVALGLLDRIDWRFLSTAGAVSYPLYLIHQAIGVRLLHLWRDQVPAWPLLLSAVAAATVVAWLIHRCVERPGAALLRRALSSPAAGRADGLWPR
ncbi:acyltransferase family protein [Streptomyces indicus]|uniref:Peptidoglycan/LPS O-acetylase OafA/YrhL, contains acyltransferase and SGNH-hydrolase domains n=1 Tax=Streptomyces indicus TaxID=417292 RepID=A0A1G9E184_9ACTN|nr:acyltransferase [Streptomyces indicus]SDK69877.1 Peptidoglycan/LPS O-acetylase OafA/YrhL, contains acyltransferase and SGNH-hydrolase domains [Streptomyces indicus]